MSIKQVFSGGLRRLPGLTRPSAPRPLPAQNGAATASSSERLLVLDDRTDLAEGVVGLTFRSPDGAALPAWLPGAHLELLVEAGGTPMLRQYSLCGSPDDSGSWRVAVLREAGGRGGSVHLHDRSAVGDLIRVRGPRNHFPLADAERYRFVAGGIGITPMLPMIEAAEAAGADWQLFYGGRSRASMAFLDELARYGDRVLICPQDETGLLDLGAAVSGADASTAVYCCGPEPLLAAIEERCSAGFAGTLHVERFHAPEGKLSGPTSEFEVELVRTGVTLRVPEELSVLDVVEEAGVPTSPSCRQGTCGSCETRVLAGSPEHRDSCLSEVERSGGDIMLICVSRSADGGRLVLDL